MGVTGLWTVVQPCARPIKIETLNKKRLAVDASIWIYQFLKAVRDKEGNALRNSHVVGFFRRICKLLFFGIKPVFVFDGGAPILKRQTVSGRKARREGRREDAVRTAGKLLAVQMQRRAEEDDRKRREERDGPPVDQEEEVPENLVYVDELQMTEKERLQNRTFKKKDAYHLPNLDVDLTDMGAPNDPRIMSHEELEEYARQFHTGEDVNIYDFSKIDFNSPFFLSLPASDRYNILNAARLRSRLRMGYSKEQLDTMFPDRMAFSRFQIDRVKERNELTQRLMNLNGMNGEDAMLGINNGGRVAGEKGKEYVLVKNDGVEGGWALGVVSNKGEGERSKPIDVEAIGKEDEVTDEDEAREDDGFEDVPIEGLNRLPRRPNRPADASNDDASFETEGIKKRRQALYEARMEAAGVKRTAVDPDLAEEELDSLFVPQQNGGQMKDHDEDVDELFEDVLPTTDTDDDDLKRAIAMSLENPQNDSADEIDMPSFSNSALAGPRIDQPLEFNHKNAKAGRDFAHLANARAHQSAPRPFVDESDDDENDLDMQAALAESRRTKYQSQGGLKASGSNGMNEQSGGPREPMSSPAPPTAFAALSPTPASSSLSAGFDGPLPFESLNLGTSILGRKKKQSPAVPAGGFEKESNTGGPAQVLPPWFSGDIREATAAQKTLEESQYEGGDPKYQSQLSDSAAILKRQETGEVIDLEAPREQIDEIIDVGSSDEGDADDFIMGDTRPVVPEVRMGDVADLSRAEPPSSDFPASDLKAVTDQVQEANGENEKATEYSSDHEEPIDWSESDPEEETKAPRKTDEPEPTGGVLQEQNGSASPELENVGVAGSPSSPHDSVTFPDREVQPPPSLPRGQSSTGPGLEDLPADEEDMYSDPEEEDLMRQLAIEAEEHARFASTLNSKSQLQNAEDYEKELRQLRNQQKKDRRVADEVTHIMVTECQQLLKLFGLPYVTAPMEAEAQCAELVSLGIVDGIVTDDSDVFLFGGTRVYKNMFNQAKFVECYLSSDLEKEYSLDRQKLIRIAHLLGSDYTEGLPSVGPVTALEILSEFETLEQFSEWWETVQMGQKLSAEDSANSFRRKFRKNASKLFLPATFPDKRVDQAYLHPEVDSDPSPFQWGVPDLDSLRSFLMATIGWSQDRTDEVLVPVIKDMNRRENEGTQANITQFFGGGVGIGGKSNGGGGSAFAPRRRLDGKSKRMETALGRLHEQARNRTSGEGESNVEVDAEPSAVGNGDANGTTDAAAEPRRKPQRKSKKRAAPVSTSGSNSESEDGNDEYEAPAKSRKRGHSSAKGSSKGRKKGKAQT